MRRDEIYVLLQEGVLLENRMPKEEKSSRKAASFDF